MDKEEKEGDWARKLPESFLFDNLLVTPNSSSNMMSLFGKIFSMIVPLDD